MTIIIIGNDMKKKKSKHSRRGYGKVHTCLTVPMSYGVRVDGDDRSGSGSESASGFCVTKGITFVTILKMTEKRPILEMTTYAIVGVLSKQKLFETSTLTKHTL